MYIVQTASRMHGHCLGVRGKVIEGLSTSIYVVHSNSILGEGDKIVL
jgi:hypothetical protein